MFYHPDLFLQHSSNWFHLLSLINDQRWFLHFICVSSTVGCTHQTILLFSSLSLSVFLSLHVLLLAWSSACLFFFMHVLVVWLDSARLLPLLLPSLSPPSIPLLLLLSCFFLFVPPPSPIAVLTPVRNSSSSLSSHNSSETGTVGSLLILADGMVVEHPEDFYRMQVSADLHCQASKQTLWLVQLTYYDNILICRQAPPPPALAPPTQRPPRW